MKIVRLRKISNKLGRAGVSELALKCIEDFDGSYKGVMELSGKLSLIAKMSTFDEYWNEQVRRGEYRMTDKLQNIEADLERKEIK